MSETYDESQSGATDGLVSRREFGVMTVAAGLTVASGAAYAATPVAERAVSIKTADGTCDAVLVHPQGKGRVPAVILWPDAFGLRPAKVEMAKRLADHGYAVLVVNQYYRMRPAPALPPGFSFSNPDDRASLMKYIAELDQNAITRDTKSFIAFLDAQPEVDRKAKFGTVGFCMGGRMTVWTAAAAPDRAGAAISFHGGSLVTDGPDSPHKLIAGTKASYHFGIGIDDDEKEPNTKTALKQALDAAGRPGTVEVYPGAKHGWMVSDSAIYNREQAERGWDVMTALYKKALV